MKSILLIGLGRFGRYIAEKLHDMQHDVLAVDHDEDRVNRILPLVTNALIADSTNADFLQSLGIPSFDVCIVAIGDDFVTCMRNFCCETARTKQFIRSASSPFGRPSAAAPTTSSTTSRSAMNTPSMKCPCPERGRGKASASSTSAASIT